MAVRRSGVGGIGHPRFANAYFVHNRIIRQILNPLLMPVALAWAAGASEANVATAKTGSHRPMDNLHGL